MEWRHAQDFHFSKTKEVMIDVYSGAQCMALCSQTEEYVCRAAAYSGMHFSDEQTISSTVLC